MRPADVTCSFDNTDFLQVGCQPTMLAKGQHLDIPITFAPQRAQKYEATVALRVLAGMYTHEISISGEAVPLKLELMDVKQRHISLGAVVLGSKVQRKSQVSQYLHWSVSRLSHCCSCSNAPSDEAASLGPSG